MFKREKNKMQDNKEKVDIGWQDIIAIMIAQFQILFPIMLGFVAVVTLLFLFVFKVWLKQ